MLDDTLLFSTIDSTNLEAHRNRERFAGRNVLLIAEEQTAGKGRLDRTWESKSGLGLWASLFIGRTEFFRYDLQYLSLLTGIVIQRTLTGLCDIQTQLKQFTELPHSPVVVFQDLDDPPVAAVFGEVMCSTYQAFGSVGLVTNGGGRDLDQVRALDFPVFTGSTICSHAYCHLLHLGLPVRVGGLMVNHGDLLHGDANGVTSVPPEIAADAADIADEFVAAEEIMLDYVKGPGEKSISRFSELRKEFQSVVAKLKERVAQKRG
jgi:regulator of RNase E activity RraA